MADDVIITAQSDSRSPSPSGRPLERADNARQHGHILLGLTYAMLMLAIASVQKYPDAPPWPYTFACAALLLVATVFAYRSARKKMRIAVDRYGQAVEVNESSWVIYGRWIRVVLLHVSIVSFLVAGLMTPAGSTELPRHPVTWIVLATGFGAFLLTALPRRPTSQAQTQEERERAAGAIRPVIAELADEIDSKLEEIAVLHNETGKRRDAVAELRKIAMDRLDTTIDDLAGVNRRKNRRAQLRWFLLGIPVGFIINWTSQPLLDVLGQLFK